MAIPPAQVVKVNWKLVFPWLALFRVLGLALHVRQVFVGVIAVLLVTLGDWFILDTPFPRAVHFPNLDPGLLSWIWMPVVDLTWPLVSHHWPSPVQRPDSQFSVWWQAGQSLIGFAWVLVIGSFAGGILSRRAAIEFAREESVGLLTTVRYVLKRWLDYLSAPLLPFVAILALGGLLAVGGLIQNLPGGHYLISALWAFVVLVGVMMAVLLIALITGWPMMIAAVSINGGDGFDALSRGFGFVLDRWRYYAWCVAVMTAYSAVCLLMLIFVVQQGEFLAASCLRMGSASWESQSLPHLVYDSLWADTVRLIIRGFAYSFFWSSVAVIYLVLRQSIDNAELHDVFDDSPIPPADDLQALINPQLASPSLLPIIDQP